MADATNTIAAGEVLQLMNSRDPDTTEIRYMEVIYRKTAHLFEAGAQIAAIVARAPAGVEAALARYGKHLGIAFQLVDDALDYRGDADELGKNVGDDLAEGKPTLPLIHALAHSDAESASLIRNAIEHGGIEEQGPIRAVVESTGGLDYTARLAEEEAKARGRRAGGRARLGLSRCARRARPVRGQPQQLIARAPTAPVPRPGSCRRSRRAAARRACGRRRADRRRRRRGPPRGRRARCRYATRCRSRARRSASPP